jgi:hypothetical protein
MQNTTFLMPKNAEKCREYFCKTCDFKCSKKSNYEKHLLTKKHNTTNTTKIQPKNAEYYKCDCGKEYKYRGSLHNHKKICYYKNDDENIEIEYDNEVIELKDHIITKEDETNMVVKLMKQNSELMEVIKDQNETMKEMIPNIGNNNNNTNNTNNNFNLQVFLKEDCKDALNIMDFISSLQIQLKDLESTGKMGFAESTTNLLIEGLKGLDITKRPIHCSDLKRETLYIKNAGNWEKGEASRDEMKKAIDKISKNNVQQFGQWINENPQCKVAHTPKADQFHQISSEVSGSTQEKNIDKVIRKIAKGTTIDKNNA